MCATFQKPHPTSSKKVYFYIDMVLIKKTVMNLSTGDIVMILVCDNNKN